MILLLRSYIKLIYSENATKVSKLSEILFFVMSIKGWRFCHIFVAFSEYINFKKSNVTSEDFRQIVSTMLLCKISCLHQQYISTMYVLRPLKDSI